MLAQDLKSLGCLMKIASVGRERGGGVRSQPRLGQGRKPIV